MSNSLGPIDVVCDAPPYSVVQACGSFGFRSPEDVRWCRMCHFPETLAALADPPRPSWTDFLGLSSPPSRTCACGQTLPQLEAYEFTFRTGQQSTYLLGQCRRCYTMFWKTV